MSADQFGDLVVVYGLTPEKVATVNRLRAEGKSWAAIAVAVGWHAPTLFQHVAWALQRTGQPLPAGCPDLDPNWPDTNNRPRGPRLCTSYPRCPCGKGTHRQSEPGDGRTVEVPE